MFLQQVVQKIDELVENSPPLIRGDLQTLTGHPGKLLRPAFFLLCAQGGETPQEELISVAAALELLHIASLAHDDVLDGSLHRRGKVTLFRKEGAKRAILAGDYLLAQALILSSGNYQASLVPVMTESIKRLCISEIDQDAGKGGFYISREQYFQRIRGKTAELFGLSCFAGALLGGREKDVQNNLYDMGIEFGIAFQIRDDVMDYTGNVLSLGKQSGNDLKEGIPTLPLILALESKNSLPHFLLKKPFRPLFSSFILSLLESGGYLDRATHVSKEYLDRSNIRAEQSLQGDALHQFHDIIRALQKSPKR